MDKFISSFNDSKSLTRVDKGMWVDGDRGVGVLTTAIPILSDSNSRKQSIVNDTPAIFNIEGYEKNKSDEIPYYQRHSIEEVTENSNLIDTIVPINAFTNDINHNRLIRAIIYLESTHGWYDDYPIVNFINKSFRPMNINYNYWIDLINQFHYTKDQVKYDKTINIEIGYEITKRIIERIENPSIEKIGSIYNSLGKEKISNYGVLLKKYYDEESWLKPKAPTLDEIIDYISDHPFSTKDF